VNQKAQVSLEYILIALATVIVLSLIILQATTLYSKNIQQIDNKELKSTYDKIQGNLNILELTNNYYEEIKVYPQSTWSLTKNNASEYILSNKNKEYTIYTTEKIQTQIKEIKTESIIIIKKEDNKIYLEIKT